MGTVYEMLDVTFVDWSMLSCGKRIVTTLYLSLRINTNYVCDPMVQVLALVSLLMFPIFVVC
jgi:hypothetical protein